MFCCWCLRRRQCKKCSFWLIAFATCLVLYILYQVKQNKCSNEESQKLISDVCQEYTHHQISGNLCPALCIDHTIVFQHCLNYRGGKIIVVCSYETTGTSLILKLGKHDHDKLEVNHLSLNQFYNIISNTLKFHFSVDLERYANEAGVSVEKIGEKFAEDMWLGDKVDQDATSKQQIQAYVKSLWKLLQQEEYITMQSLKSIRHIPKILGSCGPIYAMEFSPPGPVLSQGFPSITSSQITWTEKVNVALGVLDLLKAFSNIGPLYDQLHFCDIKGENFGIDRDGIVKAIDVDMAFVDHKLGDELGFPNCTKHSDCDFFECWGWCDLAKKKCTRTRRNNNLQGVCLKIFTSRSANALRGLLSNPPALYKDKIQDILAECVEPTDWSDEKIRYRATEKTHQALEMVLRESVNA